MNDPRRVICLVTDTDPVNAVRDFILSTTDALRNAGFALESAGSASSAAALADALSDRSAHHTLDLSPLLTGFSWWGIPSRAARVDAALASLKIQAGTILIAFNTALQRSLGAWRGWKKPQIFHVRVWWEEIELTPNRLDQFALNRYTEVNLQLNYPRPRQSTDPERPGRMELDNPYYLPDGAALSDESAHRWADACLAMRQPSRARYQFRPAVNSSHIKLTYITHFYLNQSNPDSIMQLLEQYAAYPRDVLDQMHFVIVDDGSPLDYAVPTHFDLNLTWLKINEDIRWNQGGARNLGAVYAKSDTMLITDLDLTFPPETFREILRRGPCGKTIYKFNELDPETGRISKGHPNNFCLSRSRFLRFYGYDEEFTGNYGAEDFRFLKLQKLHGSRVKYLGDAFPFIRRKKLDRKKSYHSLVRDLSINTPIDSRKRHEIDFYGHETAHSKMFLEFTWKILHQQQRTTRPEPVQDSGWKNGWIWRTLRPW